MFGERELICGISKNCAWCDRKAAHAMVEGLALVMTPFVRWKAWYRSDGGTEAAAGMKYFVAGIRCQRGELERGGDFGAAEDCVKKRCYFSALRGASALVELPLDPAQTLEDVQIVHRALVTCGASIEEIIRPETHLGRERRPARSSSARPANEGHTGVSDVPVGKSRR